jgi:hypothetical protein
MLDQTWQNKGLDLMCSGGMCRCMICAAPSKYSLQKCPRFKHDAAGVSLSNETLKNREGSAQNLALAPPPRAAFRSRDETRRGEHRAGRILDCLPPRLGFKMYWYWNIWSSTMSSEHRRLPNPITDLPKRRLACPYCHDVCDHTEMLPIQKRVICKKCKKVFHADTKNNSYPAQ